MKKLKRLLLMFVTVLLLSINVFCAFGCHLEKCPNRFQKMEFTHPQLYDYCMKSWNDGGLGMAGVLDYIGVPYMNNVELINANGEHYQQIKLV